MESCGAPASSGVRHGSREAGQRRDRAAVQDACGACDGEQSRVGALCASEEAVQD